jgi:hypothetical protein
MREIKSLMKRAGGDGRRSVHVSHKTQTTMSRGGIFLFSFTLFRLKVLIMCAKRRGPKGPHFEIMCTFAFHAHRILNEQRRTVRALPLPHHLRYAILKELGWSEEELKFSYKSSIHFVKKGLDSGRVAEYLSRHIALPVRDNLDVILQILDMRYDVSHRVFPGYQQILSPRRIARIKENREWFFSKWSYRRHWTFPLMVVATPPLLLMQYAIMTYKQEHDWNLWKVRAQLYILDVFGVASQSFLRNIRYYVY